MLLAEILDGLATLAGGLDRAVTIRAQRARGAVVRARLDRDGDLARVARAGDRKLVVEGQSRADVSTGNGLAGVSPGGARGRRGGANLTVSRRRRSHLL